MLQVLVQQRCEVLAELMKRCLDEERLLLDSISSSDVTTLVFHLVVLRTEHHLMKMLGTGLGLGSRFFVCLYAVTGD